jgi:hypothetical protein
MHKEFGRLNVQLLGDVFADFGLAALTTGAGFKLVAIFDTRQMIGQRLKTPAWTEGRVQIRTPK